jgi:hypothetical protein
MWGEKNFTTFCTLSITGPPSKRIATTLQNNVLSANFLLGVHKGLGEAPYYPSPLAHDVYGH